MQETGMAEEVAELAVDRIRVSKLCARHQAPDQPRKVDDPTRRPRELHDPMQCLLEQRVRGAMLQRIEEAGKNGELGLTPHEAPSDRRREKHVAIELLCNTPAVILSQCRLPGQPPADGARPAWR